MIASRKDRWLWAILILGAAVRLPGLGERSLSYDECQQFWASQGSVIVSNREITLDPPLFAALLHFHSMGGRSETWLRLLPCLFGILAIPAVYYLARTIARDEQTARIAAFFTALAPYPIRYSQSLRVYSLALLLCSLLPAAFLETLEEERPRRWVLVAILLCAALLTLYGAVWLLLGMGLVLVARAPRKGGSAALRGVPALAAGVALALPFYVLSLPQQTRSGTPPAFYDDKFLPTGSLRPALGFLARSTLDLLGYLSFIHPVAAVAFGMLAVMGMIRLCRRRIGAGAGLLLLVGIGAAAVASAFRLYPYGGTRQMLFVFPLYAVFVAAGIGHLQRFARGSLAIGALAAIAGGSAVFLYRYHTEPGARQEMRPVVRFLEERVRPGDRILVNKDAVPQFRFYFRGNPAAVVWGKETVIRHYLPEIDRTLSTHPADRWWLVFSHGWEAKRREELSGVDWRFILHDRFEAPRAAVYLLIPRGEPILSPPGGGARP